MASNTLGRTSRFQKTYFRSTVFRASVPHRTFSSSPYLQKDGALPAFETSKSSDELREHLSLIRSKIFLPSQLSAEQSKLIYSPKNQRMLQDDPVYVELGGEKHRLEFLDRTVDLPSRRKSFHRAITLFEKTDWQNLPALYEGMMKAGIPIDLTPDTIIRAGKAGRCDVIVECLRRSSKTGLKIKAPWLVDDLMRGILLEAAESGWAASKVKKALSLSEELMSTLEDSPALWQGTISVNPSTRPQAIAPLLRLSAAQAELKYGGKDTDKQVAMYGQRLLDATENDPATSTSTVQALGNTGHELSRSAWLISVLPILSAWEAAAKMYPHNEQFSGRVAAVKAEIGESLVDAKKAQPVPRSGVTFLERAEKALLGVRA